MYQGQGSSGSAGPSRREDYGRREDDRINGHREPYQNRPRARPSPVPTSFRGFPAYGSRARTPSPPPRRDFDRDRYSDYDRDWDRNGVNRNGGPEGPPRRGGPPIRDRPPERDWDRPRVWNDRRDDRYRDDGRIPPPNRPSSSGMPSRLDRPLLRSPPPGPRGPRGPNQSPPFTSTPRVSSGPRIGASIPPWEDRDRDRDQPSGRPFNRAGSVPGPGPSTTAYNQQTRYSPPSPSEAPRAPRSLRGSSSPVEAKRERPSPRSERLLPLPVNNTTNSMHPRNDTDIEEGEVLSPVKRIDNWTPEDRDRGRNGWVSPQRDRDRDSYNRPGWDRGRIPEPVRRRISPGQERRVTDSGWSGRGRRRSLSSSGERRGFGMDGATAKGFPQAQAKSLSPEKRIASPVREISLDPESLNRLLMATHAYFENSPKPFLFDPEPPRSPLKQSSPLRPATGLGIEILPAVEEESMADPRSATPLQRPDTPAFPPPPIVMQNDNVLPLETDPVLPEGELTERPSTSPVPIIVTPPTDKTVGSTEVVQTSPKAANPVPALVTVIPGFSHITETATKSGVLLSIETEVKIEAEDVEMQSPAERPVAKVESTTVELSIPTSPIIGTDSPSDHVPSTAVVTPPPEPVPHKVTLAERRSIQLPSPNSKLASPFGAKFTGPDPTPTNDSVVDQTDADNDGTQHGDAGDDTTSQMSEGYLENVRMTNLMATIKRQARGVCNFEAVYAWNAAVAPVPSSRVNDFDLEGRETHLQSISGDLARTQRPIGGLTADLIQRKRDELEAKVERLGREYRQLDTEWKQHHAHLRQTMEKRGQPPEDFYALPNAFPTITPGPIPTTPLADDSFTSRRRRTQGDSVLTDAALEEVLAGLADTHSRDPDARARKTAATIPAMILGPERHDKYDDENDIVEDPLAFYDFAGIAEPYWSEAERTTFTRRYMANAKMFGKIAEGLPYKSAADCVLFYYRTKKEANYKDRLASRRNSAGKKKATLPIKKGKSASLLSTLAGRGPGEGSSRGGAATMTPSREGSTSTGRRGRPPRSESTIPATPGDDGSNATSRAPSEAPSSQKPKMRMSGKVKRPRISSLTQVVQPDGSVSLVPGPTGDESNDSELLPAVKRAAKRRKGPVDPNNPNAVELKDKVPRRPGATNSYWSAPEKKRFVELVAAHGCDFIAIASALEGKSLVQVRNFFVNNRDSLKLDQVASLPPPDQVPGIPTKIDSRDNAGQPLTRVAYDQYGREISHHPSHPRLAVFPGKSPDSKNRPLPESPINQPPVRARMGISALLNDDSPEKPKSYDVTDAASDGTVDERELDAGTRPVPRPAPPTLNYARQGEYERRPSHGSYERPDLDRFAPAKSYTYTSSAAPPWPNDSRYYAGGRAGAPPPAQTNRSWEGQQQSRSAYPPHPHPAQHSQHPQLGVFPSSRAPDTYRRVSIDRSYPSAVDHRSAHHDRPSDWRSYMSTPIARDEVPPNRMSPTRPGYPLPSLSNVSAPTRPYDPQARNLPQPQPPHRFNP